jgi:hypothetical protein
MKQSIIRYVSLFFVFFVLAVSFAKMKPYYSAFQNKIDKNKIDNQLQRYLDIANIQNNSVNVTIHDALRKIPHAARIRVALIHLREGTLRYDITNAIASPDHVAGALIEDHPVSEWQDWLADLLKGNCIVVNSAAITDLNFRQRVTPLSNEFLVCPILSKDRLIGAVSVSADDEQPIDMDEARPIMQNVAENISKILAAN